MSDPENGASGNVLRRLFARAPVAYYPELAEALGSIAAAIFLQEVGHWDQYSEDGWVFRTQDEIRRATALRVDAQNGARKILRDLDIIEEERKGVPARLYYRVNWDKLQALLQTQEVPEQDTRSARNKTRRNPGTIYTGKYTGNNTPSEVKTPLDPMKNVGGYFCAVARAMGVHEPEDDTITAGNFRKLCEKEKLSREDRVAVASKILEARANGFTLSPQKALNKVRYGNVVPFEKKGPDPSTLPEKDPHELEPGESCKFEGNTFERDAEGRLWKTGARRRRYS